jgi:hypothetical protein
VPRGLAGHQIVKPPVATGAFDLDDLAEDGAPLVAATAALTTKLIQHFGASSGISRIVRVGGSVSRSGSLVRMQGGS